MSLKKILTTLFTVFATVTAQADISDGHFSSNQIFDVQYYWSGTTLNASNFIAPYDMNFTHPTVTAGQYFAFFASTTNPGTYGLGLYNSDGTLAQVLHNTGTLQAIGPSAIFYVGSGFFGTVISTGAGYNYGQSAQFTNMNTSPTSSDFTSYTWASTTPLTAGQTAGSGAPTVVSTSTTNTVTSTTTNGAPTTTITAAPGAPIVTTATALNRGAQTTKTLAVNNVLTTTTYNPVITTTTITTPTTVTTTTTPVTTTTYSDNTTTTTTGSAVVTTSSGTPIVSSSSVTNNGTPTVTDQVIQTWTTRIDGVDRTRQSSGWINQAMTGGITERFTVDGDKIKQRTGAFGDENQGWMYIIGESQFNKTEDGYKAKGNLTGLGYERKFTKSLIVGVNYAQADGGLTGNQAGGDYSKQIATLYSLYAFNGWMLNTTLGHSGNKFTNYHGIQDLNIMNTGSTNGIDNWLHNRLYTPEFNNFKLLVGVRTDQTRLNGFTESGSALTAMTYNKVDQLRNTNEYGVRWDRQWEKLVFGAEYAMNSDRLQTSTVTIGFAPATNVIGSLGFRNQKQNGIENNVGFTSITWKF